MSNDAKRPSRLTELKSAQFPVKHRSEDQFPKTEPMEGRLSNSGARRPGVPVTARQTPVDSPALEQAIKNIDHALEILPPFELVELSKYLQSKTDDLIQARISDVTDRVREGEEALKNLEELLLEISS